MKIHPFSPGTSVLHIIILIIVLAIKYYYYSRRADIRGARGRRRLALF